MGGAPTKYKSEYCNDLIEYFDVEPFTLKDGPDGKQVIVPNKFPTLARFALKIGVHRDSLHEWSRVHDSFSDAIKKAKDYQEAFLIEAALAGCIDKTFAIFVAKNILGWTDKGASDFVRINLDECDTAVKKLDKLIDLVAKGEVSVSRATELANIIKTANQEDYSELKDRLDKLEAALNG